MAFFIIDQQAVDSGRVINVASASANTPSGSTVSDTSDDPVTAQADDPTIVSITSTPSIEVTKTVSVTDTNEDGVTGENDLIYYDISIENTGDLTLTNITINDILTDGNGQALSLLNGPTYDGLAGSKGSSQGTALPGEVHNYTAIYLISPQQHKLPLFPTLPSLQPTALDRPIMLVTLPTMGMILTATPLMMQQLLKFLQIQGLKQPKLQL